MRNGAILFRAQDTAGNAALCVAVGGAFNRVIGTGDTLDGGHIPLVTSGAGPGVNDPAPNALAANGTIAIHANLDNSNFQGIFAAVPNCAPDVSGQVSITASGFRATGQYVQRVTVQIRAPPYSQVRCRWFSET